MDWIAMMLGLGFDTTLWDDTIEWPVRCDWLQVATVVTRILQV